jgi:hypothetical protein
MKWMPSFMLLRTDSVDFAGTNFTWIMKSEMMTATKEMPLRVKHQVAPRVV